MTTQDTTKNNRTRKLVTIANEILNLSVPVSNDHVVVRDLGTKLSTYVTDEISTELITDADFDLETIDSLFIVKKIIDTDILEFNADTLIGSNADEITIFLYNLENLKRLLEIIGNKSSAVEKTETKEIVETDNKSLTIFDSSNSSSKLDYTFDDDMMQQLMLNEVLSAFSHNPMVSMALMQKMGEGKLTTRVLTQLSTISGGITMRNSPMTTMMVMQILNKV